MDPRILDGEERLLAFLHAMSESAGHAQLPVLDIDALPPQMRKLGRALIEFDVMMRERTRHLEQGAYTDQLTGVGNRGGFDRQMAELWAKQEPFTCAYIDIDHLKHCNDSFGHAEGNRYITTVCRALAKTLQDAEALYRVGGDEFILLSRTASESELEERLERCRERVIANTSGPESPMVFSFSYGCSHADPAAGDTRRQMTLDADRKMYSFKLLHRVEQPTPLAGHAAPALPSIHSDRVFQALGMANEDRYLFAIDLDTRESQWSLNAVRDFGLPSEHPLNSMDLWIDLVHPDDRDNVTAELVNIVNGTWHFHTMQYRVMTCAGEYALCEARGYRLDGANGEHSVYTGSIVNRSLAEVTDSVTGLGDVHALITAIGECRRNGSSTGIITIKVDDIARVNETFGYDAGDRVLSETAGCIVDASRSRARVFRSHGVTFMAVYEGVTPEELEAARHELHDSLMSPVLLGDCPYLPPVRIDATYMESVESQPSSIITELGHKAKQAEQVPGTPL